MDIKAQILIFQESQNPFAPASSSVSTDGGSDSNNSGDNNGNIENNGTSQKIQINQQKVQHQVFTMVKVLNN